MPSVVVDEVPSDAIAAAAPAADTPAAVEVVDLTLSDDDDVGGNAPSLTTAAAHRGGGDVGRYAKFSRYATSLREREAAPRKRRSEGAAVKPKAMPPRKRNKTTASGSGDDKVKAGDVRYAFHERFVVGEGKDRKAKMFHGEVVEIVGAAVAKNGKDRRVVYEDGQTDYLSLKDIRRHSPCRNKNCKGYSLVKLAMGYPVTEDNPNNASSDLTPNDTETDDDSKGEEEYQKEEEEEEEEEDDGMSSPADSSNEHSHIEKQFRASSDDDGIRHVSPEGVPYSSDKSLPAGELDVHDEFEEEGGKSGSHYDDQSRFRTKSCQELVNKDLPKGGSSIGAQKESEEDVVMRVPRNDADDNRGKSHSSENNRDCNIEDLPERESGAPLDPPWWACGEKGESKVHDGRSSNDDDDKSQIFSEDDDAKSNKSHPNSPVTLPEESEGKDGTGVKNIAEAPIAGVGPRPSGEIARGPGDDGLRFLRGDRVAEGGLDVSEAAPDKPRDDGKNGPGDVAVDDVVADRKEGPGANDPERDDEKSLFASSSDEDDDDGAKNEDGVKRPPGDVVDAESEDIDEKSDDEKSLFASSSDDDEAKEEDGVRSPPSDLEDAGNKDMNQDNVAELQDGSPVCDDGGMKRNKLAELHDPKNPGSKVTTSTNGEGNSKTHVGDDERAGDESDESLFHSNEEESDKSLFHSEEEESSRSLFHSDEDESSRSLFHSDEEESNDRIFSSDKNGVAGGSYGSNNDQQPHFQNEDMINFGNPVGVVSDVQAGHFSYVGNPDDEGSHCSRFSQIENDVEDWPETTPKQREHPSKKLVVKKRLKKQMDKSMVSKNYTMPRVVRHEPVFYYFGYHWGKRMTVEELREKDGPPPKSLDPEDNYGINYDLLCSKLISRKGNLNVPAEDGMGNSKYKSYYLATSGYGIEDKMDLKSALLSIADFDTLTYERGAQKTASRLELLVSPSCGLPGDPNTPCFYKMDENEFQVIDDDGHMGCGFIPKERLLKLLGNSEPANRAFAIQVRIVGPSSIGIAKGMLFVKDGIEKIQIPTSMVKVKKSKSNKPLHIYVALTIRQIFPWTKHETLGRWLSDVLKRPTFLQMKDLIPPKVDVEKVLECKGVSRHVLDTYKEDFRQHKRVNSAYLVGVSDPTGYIPSGHVFLTGMCKRAPSRVFLTRNPCTEGNDGIVLKVASIWAMPKQTIEFWDSVGFGAVVFPLGDELASRVNDGDLDGDAYCCIWDEEVLGAISIDHENDESNYKILTDDFVGTPFQHKIGGKEYDSFVAEKIGENLYRVKTGRNMRTSKEMTREQIEGDKDWLLKIVGHQLIGGARHGSKQKSSVEFNCQWAIGINENGWLSIEEIFDLHAGPPPPLMEYAQKQGLLKDGSLPQKFSKWIDGALGKEDMEEIIKHRTKKNGKIKVRCRYSDGEKLWLPIEEVKKDSKIFLGQYAKKKKLFNTPGWEEMDRYWLDEVQDIWCNEGKRSHKICRLRQELCRLHRKSHEELGPRHPNTVVFGRAYKRSNDIEKHGGLIYLPLHLYHEVPKSLRDLLMIE